MPTGYTADVADGKVSDFRTFALRCARAFGATIMQRDDPANDPPKHREVSDYYLERVAEAKAEILRLSTLSVDDAEGEAAAEYAERIKQDKRWEAERKAKRARYEAMLAEVEAWNPPTDDHAELKNFMASQLRESIKFDCSGYPITKQVRYTASMFLAQAKAKAAADLAYAESNLADEVERCEKANAWIDALNESLAVETVVGGSR